MTPRFRKPKIIAIGLPIVVLTLGIALAAYFIGSRPKARPRDSQEIAQAVAVVLAKRQTHTPVISNFGEVVASREAELRAMVAGRLVFIAEQVQDGAVITAGTKIAEIDPFEYELAMEQASANVTEAEARLLELRADFIAEQKLLSLAEQQIQLRQRDRDRSKDLIKKGQTSKKALDDAEIALNAAKEAHQQRRQGVTRTEAKIAQQQAAISRLRALLAQAERNLQDTAIVAPFSGYLTDTTVALGKRLGIGESIGRLIARDELQVRFELNNDDYARLISQGKSDSLLGREVEVNWRLGDSLLRFDGRIERRGAEIDPSSGGVRVFARVTDVESDDQPIDALRPGAFVEVSLADISYPSVVALPEEALVDGNRIFSVVEGALQSIQVDVVRRHNNEVLVRGEIADDTAIVTTPFPTIGPGMRVRVLAQ